LTQFSLTAPIHLEDRRCVNRPLQHGDLVAGFDAPRRDDAQIGAEPACLSEAFDPAALVFSAHPASERLARVAARGDLHDGALADLPALADLGAVQVHAIDAQVLSEPSGRQVPSEFLCPVRSILLRVRVHGLVEPPVMLAVRLHVAIESVRSDTDRAGHRALVDRRRADGTDVRSQLMDHADGDDPGAHRPDIPST
jgi:hypothetical protein